MELERLIVAKASHGWLASEVFMLTQEGWLAK